MQPSCTNCLCTVPWLSKNTISIVFNLDFWKRIFFGRGECSPTHLELFHFVSGLYTKHQLSSPVITLSRKFLSPLIMFNRSWHAATRSSICSCVSVCRTNLEHSFHFFKSSFKICRTPVFGMPGVSAVNQDITFRSFWPFCRWRRCHWFNLLWADHCVRLPSLTLYPLGTICATQSCCST